MVSNPIGEKIAMLEAKVERLEAIIDGKTPHPNGEWIWTTHLELDYGGHTRKVERRKSYREGLAEAAKMATDKAEQLDGGSNCEIEAQQWLLHGLADDILAAAKDQP